MRSFMIHENQLYDDYRYLDHLLNIYFYENTHTHTIIMISIYHQSTLREEAERLHDDGRSS